MTTEEIRRLPAGRELDIQISLCVFGEKPCRRPGQLHATLLTAFYSSDISAAWRVIEHLRSLGWEYQLHDEKGGHCCELFKDVRGKGAWAPEVCVAICRAALLAVTP